MGLLIFIVSCYCNIYIKRFMKISICISICISIWGNMVRWFLYFPLYSLWDTVCEYGGMVSVIFLRHGMKEFGGIVPVFPSIFIMRHGMKEYGRTPVFPSIFIARHGMKEYCWMVPVFPSIFIMRHAMKEYIFSWYLLWGTVWKNVVGSLGWSLYFPLYLLFLHGIYSWASSLWYTKLGKYEREAKKFKPHPPRKFKSLF